MRSIVKKRIGLAVGGAVLLMAVFLASRGQSPDPHVELIPLRIAAMPHSFAGYTVFLAARQGFFRDQGLDVALVKSFSSGMATLNALAQGQSQFAVSSETPFINSVLAGQRLYCAAITITAEDHLAVVGRKDRGIKLAGDLRGKRIGVTIGSNGEYFLDMVLNLNGGVRQQVEIVGLKPSEMVEHLTTGKVDAVATWNPVKLKAVQELGKNAVIFTADGMYSPAFILSTTQSFASANPETLVRVVRALFHATEFINADKNRSHRIIAEEMQTEPGLLNQLAASYTFKVSLDQSFLTTLENQAYWALRRTGGSRIPDFLDYIYLDALEKTDPGAVTIIR